MTVYNKKNGVLNEAFVSREDTLYWPLSLWRGSRCREVMIRMNVLAIRWRRWPGFIMSSTVDVPNPFHHLCFHYG